MFQTISSLKTKTSAGHDEISSKLLKFCKEELISPLVDITNKSFRTGTFPSALKLAKIYPKFKQGSTNDPSNYRPISLIPTFSKLIEKLVLVRLLEHLARYQLLTPYQHGFCSGKSTITALIELVNFLLDRHEEGSTSTAVLLDYSKAFDCIDHQQLLEKLGALGIRGTTSNWFKSYITGRRQIVEIKNIRNKVAKQIKSKSRPITRGVPQGSVLGPVLFILFTNDFPQYMSNYSNTVMYADDTVLLLSNKDPEQLEVATYIALNMAIQYCHNSSLVVNEKKTKQLVFGRHKEITGRLPDLEEAASTRYLGITVDDGLTWAPHINSLCTQLSSGLYVIRRMKNISDMDTAKMTYYALFESHLRYGIAVWGGTTAGNLQRILVLQKRAIRLLGDLQPRQSCRDTYRQLKILTVINLYILEVVTYIHVKAPEEMRTSTQIHHYNTRHATNYCLPVHSSSATEKSPRYVGAKMWNILPEYLKRSGKSQFHRLLKAWLQDRPFYTVAEFFQWRGHQ